MEYKSSKFQVMLVGFLAFCGPGLFNALNGLGAAGSGSAQTAAAANGSLYATFTIFGYFSGVLINLLGPRLCFTIGGLSYAIYAVCTYYTTPDRLWLAAIGGLQLGVGAGMFWCAQSSLTMAYATQSEKATFTTIFWVIFNLGGVFGGFLQMILNWNLFTEENGGLYTINGVVASPAAYITFIALMCGGAALSFFTLCPPSKVKRSDGTSVVIEEGVSASEEIRAAIKGLTDPFVIRMALYFVFSNWFYTYEFGFLNGMMFNSRGQGMNSGLYWAAQMGGSLLFSFTVEKLGKKNGWSTKKCLKTGFYLNVAFLAVSWTLAIVVQYTSCDGRTDKNLTPEAEYIYALGTDGNIPSDAASVVNRAILSWFPDQEGYETGCDYLSAMDVKAQAMGYDACKADDSCLWNIVQCVPEGYYGRGYLDISASSEGVVCNVLDYTECMTIPVSFTSETIMIILCYICMGFSDAIFQVYCYYLMGKIAGDSLRDSARYAAAYKGIQSLGAAIVWGLDYFPEFLYRYQAFVCIAFGAVSCIGSWITIPLVARVADAQENDVQPPSTTDEGTSNAAVAEPKGSSSSEDSSSDE